NIPGAERPSWPWRDWELRIARSQDRRFAHEAVAADLGEEILQLSAPRVGRDVEERFAQVRREGHPRELLGGRIERDEANVADLVGRVDLPDGEADLHVAHDVCVETDGLVALSLV